MLVNDVRRVKTVPLGTIKLGEPFIDEEGDFMMRVEGITDADDNVYNVVNLETGIMYAFEEDLQVIRINKASLTIYD